MMKTKLKEQYNSKHNTTNKGSYLSHSYKYRTNCDVIIKW